MIGGFKKKRNSNLRPKYLTHNDVFMSNSAGSKSRDFSERAMFNRRNEPQNSNSRRFSNSPRFSADDRYARNDQYDFEEDFEDSDLDERDQPEPPYFSNRQDIIDEKMLRFERRQLPQLERYSDSNYRSQYGKFSNSYWNDADDPRYRREKNYSALSSMWQKFLITFASILSLVCLSWIAYNWKNGGAESNDGEPVVIEPERNSFKVLPESYDSNVPYTDKSVYDKLSRDESQVDQGESLLPPIEEPVVTSKLPQQDQPNVEEYSIVDDKIYYIKISAGKSKDVLASEAKLLKKKFGNVIGDKNCAVKKVSNSQGEKKYAILIGPFDSQTKAAYTAQEMGGQCYIISVKE